MTRTLLTFLMLLCVTSMRSQINEIGVSFGGSNYVGDIGNTQFIAPNKIGYGLIYKWNRSPRHSFRASFNKMNIYANDSKSNLESRKKRGYSFENDIMEMSLGLEFNFFKFDLHKRNFAATPYLYSGIAGFSYNEFHFKKGVIQEEKKEYSLAIPIIGGFKSRVGEHFVLSVEAGARYTFTNNLDGSDSKEESLQRYNFGKINNNDWYFYSNLTLTYTFGKNPCYCTP